MARLRTIAAGLVLALPAAAVIAQDNPWRVPSAPGGHVPAYAVEGRPARGANGSRAAPPHGYERTDTYRPRPAAPAYAAPQPRAWSEEPIEATRGETYPGQFGDPGFGRRQWQAPRPPAPVTTGSTHPTGADPRGRREAGLPPHPGTERGYAPPAYAPQTGQPWSGATSAGHGAGYLPPAMDPRDGPARSYNGPVYPDDPSLDPPAESSPYGEYPPLDAPSRPRFRQAVRDDAVERRRPDDGRQAGTAPQQGYGQGYAPRPYGSPDGAPGAYGQNSYGSGTYGQHPYGPSTYGPSTLTVPQTGLPGLTGGYGYGYGYGYGAGGLPGPSGFAAGGLPDPYAYPYAPPAPGW